MAKLKEEMIVRITATLGHSKETGAEIPVAWVITANPRHESRNFASYGPDASSYEYPVEKLPKAAQEFIAKHASRRICLDDRNVWMFE